MTGDAPSVRPSGRTIAIGDLHGCRKALAQLLAAIDPRPDDTLVPLGDYGARGPDTPGVFSRLFELESQCRLVTLLGNHDQALLEAVADPGWKFGQPSPAAARRLASYGLGRSPDEIDPAHLAFLKNCRLSFESPTHLFTHANYVPELPLEQTPAEALVWRRLEPPLPGPHASGKRVIVGHTAQRSYRVLDLGHVVCLDTGCCYGGWLTALEVDTAQLWQARESGARPPG